MTSVVIKYPIRKLSSKGRKLFLYKDFRNAGQYKSRTLRIRYVLGQSSASITIVDNGSAVKIVMSLFKAISGQNALTLPGMKTAAKLAFSAVARQVEKEFPGVVLRLDNERDIDLITVDIVRHHRAGTVRDVDGWLKAVDKLLERRDIRGVDRHVGNRGGRSIKINMPELGLKVKFYDKFSELQEPKRRLPQKLIDRDQLLRSMKGIIRVEVTATNKALRMRELTTVKSWKRGVRKAIFDDVIRELNLKGTFKSFGNLEVFERLDKSLRLTYLRWQAGHDLSDISRSTRSRHRKLLREKYGINIDATPAAHPSSYISIKAILADDRLVRPSKADIEKWIPAWPTAKLPSDD